MSHPSYLVPTETPGDLRIMGCPPSADLAATCADLRARGVTDILCLLPQEEAAELGVGAEAIHCSAEGIAFKSFPIRDFGLPDSDAFVGLIAWVVDALQAGRHIAVHCRAGIGRSGMVAATTLMALGAGAGPAIAVVSAARGVAIPDTVEQGDFIASLAQQL